MRIRQIKPEFWEDEDLAEVSRDARYLFIGLWNMADKEGKIKGSARLVKGHLFRYDDDVTTSVVDNWLDELANHPKRFIVRYEVGGVSYLLISKFESHQHFHKDEKAKGYPNPSHSGTISEAPCEQDASTVVASYQTAGYRVSDIGNLGSGNGESAAPCSPPPPAELEKSIELAQGYAASSANHQNASWVRGYLLTFYVLNRSKYSALSDSDVFDCWQEACQKWEKGPRYVQKVFESKLQEWTPGNQSRAAPSAKQNRLNGRDIVPGHLREGGEGKL